MDAPAYIVHRTTTPPPLTANWDHPTWQAAAPLSVAHFHPRSSAHHPHTQARLLYDDAALHLLFRVEDHYVRSVCTTLQGSVCTDSCVEFFVQPGGRGGYCNFEINAGGTLHVNYIVDPVRTAEGFKDQRRIPAADLAAVTVHPSLPAVVEPERVGPLTWLIQARIPYAFLAPYAGAAATPTPGAVWRANFYKCADHTSHPHWATWAPIGEALNFHVPEYFAELRFVG